MSILPPGTEQCGPSRVARLRDLSARRFCQRIWAAASSLHAGTELGDAVELPDLRVRDYVGGLHRLGKRHLRRFHGQYMINKHISLVQKVTTPRKLMGPNRHRDGHQPEAP